MYAVISRRFDTSYARVVRAVHNNEVGDIQVMSLTSRDSPKPSYDFLASIGTSLCVVINGHFGVEGRKEMFYLTTHSTHFTVIWSPDIW